MTNLVHLCSYHHRLVHEGGFCVEWGATRELVFRRRDGRRICEAPSPTRARGPGIVEGNHESSLVIDEWTCMLRSAGNQLDYGIAVEGLMAEVLAGS